MAVAPPNPYEQPYELTPIEPKCPKCSYDLRGLTNISGARCPECGARLPFDRLKFKRDRAAERRYRRPLPLGYHFPVFWTRIEGIIVWTIVAVSIWLLFKLQVPQLHRRWVVIVVVGELSLAHAIIIALRHWQLRSYERERLRLMYAARQKDEH